MTNLIEMGAIAGIALLALLTIGIVFSRLYKRSTKETAFVRTGLGGQKVIMDGGAILLPVFHERVLVNMNTLKLEVVRRAKESLITKDRMRVDVTAAFFVRVKQTEEAVSIAAQTLGARTMSPEELKALVEDKFVDSLRATAATMTIQELQAMWQNGAGQALELCAALGKVYGMPGLSFDAGKDLTMDWGDGVLFDRTRTWNEYMSMVTSGLLRPELALAWYFDLPHADAAQLAKIRKELMPQAAQAAPANNEEKKGETQIGA